MGFGMSLIHHNRPIEGKSGDDPFCLVFLHIPKTAGTTLASTLQWNYPPHLTLHQDLLLRPIEDMELFPLERRSSARLLRGHVPYGVHRFIPSRCEYMTVLRQPVPRAVSAYKHVLRRPGNELHERVVREGMGLEEFIETCWVGKRASRQTRQLCNRPDGAVGPSDLAEAKRNLEQFLVVGLTERFEETLALVRRALRLRVPLYVTRNVGQPLPVSARAAELIRDREPLDLELYEFASELFERQVARQGVSFRFETAAFKAMGPLARMAGSGKTAESLRRLSYARAGWSRATDERFLGRLAGARAAWEQAARSDPLDVQR
jgi:hypothetical protein